MNGRCQRTRPAWVLVGALCAACNAYDERLLDPVRIDANVLGARSRAGVSGSMRGAAGSAAVVTAGVTASAVSLPPQPGGAGCGDGRVSNGELCDTGIAQGLPGACPLSCLSTDRCWTAVVSGTGCGASCTLIAVACGTRDGCCAAQCDAGSDPDCSGSCGDAVIDRALGELCEPGDSVPQSQRCPELQDCVDDDPCTDDAVTGSASNCNAVCAHTAVNAARDGDGCCPSSADANTDGDCPAKCGNGVREGAEACDGTAGCDSSCKSVRTTAQQMCLDALPGYGCTQCECMHCTDQLLGCSASGDAARDQACTGVEACAVRNQCVGRACYCGTALTDVDCALFGNGACRDVIKAAAGSISPYVITAQTADPSSALGRALALGYCRVRQCAAECK